MNSSHTPAQYRNAGMSSQYADFQEVRLLVRHVKSPLHVSTESWTVFRGQYSSYQLLLLGLTDRPLSPVEYWLAVRFMEALPNKWQCSVMLLDIAPLLSGEWLSRCLDKPLQWLTAVYGMLLIRASHQRTHFTEAQIQQWARVSVRWHLHVLH